MGLLGLETCRDLEVCQICAKQRAQLQIAKKLASFVKKREESNNLTKYSQCVT